MGVLLNQCIAFLDDFQCFGKTYETYRTSWCSRLLQLLSHCCLWVLIHQILRTIQWVLIHQISGWGDWVPECCMPYAEVLEGKWQETFHFDELSISICWWWNALSLPGMSFSWLVCMQSAWILMVTSKVSVKVFILCLSFASQWHSRMSFCLSLSNWVLL